MRRVLLAVAALLVVVAVVLVVRATVRDAAPPREVRETPAPSAAGPASPPAAEPAVAPALAVRPEGAPAGAAAAPQQPWPAVRVAGRISDLGPAARFLNAGLSAARDEMDRCFEDEARRLETSPPPAIDPDDPPRGPAVVMLHVESLEGELVVVDAELEYLGTSTPQLFTCCHPRLVGRRMPAPGIAAGQRWRLKHLLQ